MVEWVVRLNHLLFATAEFRSNKRFSFLEAGLPRSPETYCIVSTADRTYILHHGEIVFDGDSEELVENEPIQEQYLGVGISR